jgi:hypothetical protein
MPWTVAAEHLGKKQIPLVTGVEMKRKRVINY